MKKLLFTLILATICLSLNAQTPQYRGAQVSFITPVGTNGTESQYITNGFSFNILGGYSYATEGFELGGLYNINSGHTVGAQIGGLFNMSGEVKGVQVAGLFNKSTDVEGVQIGGLANISEDIEGVQLSGIVNIAEDNRGLQVGLVNYAEESDGVQLGLINIVKEGGKHEFEVGFGESLNTYVSFRLGNKYLYTIFSGGVRYFGNEGTDFAAGLGLGTQIEWEEGWANEIEGICYSITHDGEFAKNLNLLTQLRFTFSKEFSPWFKIFAGPTLNLTISDRVGGSYWAPSAMFESQSGNSNVKGWVGFTAGVRF